MVCEIYVKVNAKQEIFDQKGLAQKLQKSWHELHKDSGVIQYENLDHMDREKRYEAGAKRYKDGETDTQFGIELTQRFQVSKNGFVYIKGAMVKDDERYAREFGQEELNRHGKLDYQHKLGIGLELRF